MKPHGNIRKCMSMDMFHEFALFVYVLTCILNVCSCFVIVFLCFRRVWAHTKRCAPKKHEFWRYSDLQMMDGLNPPNVNPINSNLQAAASAADLQSLRNILRIFDFFNFSVLGNALI